MGPAPARKQPVPKQTRDILSECSTGQRAQRDKQDSCSHLWLAINNPKAKVVTSVPCFCQPAFSYALPSSCRGDRDVSVCTRSRLPAPLSCQCVLVTPRHCFLIIGKAWELSTRGCFRSEPSQGSVLPVEPHIF